MDGHFEAAEWDADILSSKHDEVECKGQASRYKSSATLLLDSPSCQNWLFDQYSAFLPLFVLFRPWSGTSPYIIHFFGATPSTVRPHVSPKFPAVVE